jgi:hypothetical protein
MPGSRASHVRRRRWHPIALLLLLPLVGTLVPEFYNRNALLDILDLDVADAWVWKYS